jgi:hypothetical protein
MRDAMRKRARLAGAGAGDDEKRSSSLTIRLPDAVLHGLPLLRVQPIKVGDAHGRRGIGTGPTSETYSCFVRNLPPFRPTLGAL